MAGPVFQRIRWLLAAATLAALSACNEAYNAAQRDLADMHAAGRYDTAAAYLDDAANRDRFGEKSQLLLWLDRGSVALAQSLPEVAIDQLEKAEEFMESRRDPNAGDEISQWLVNDTARTYYGEPYEEIYVNVLKLAALKGIFSNIVSESVSYVNAPLLAEQRGITVRLSTDAVSDEYRNLLRISGSLASGAAISVAGTLTGTKQIQKIVEINGYDVEVPIADHLIVMVYQDRPGIVAVYGKEFGEASINIAGMQIARQGKGGQALSVLTVDSPVPEELLEKVRVAINADLLREIDITA